MDPDEKENQAETSSHSKIGIAKTKSPSLSKVLK